MTTAISHHKDQYTNKLYYSEVDWKKELYHANTEELECLY